MNILGSDRRYWFAVAFLVLNACGWWWVKSGRREEPSVQRVIPAESADAQAVAPEATKPLALTRFGQAALSPERVLTLVLDFDAAVDWPSFAERFTLLAEGEPVPWHFDGRNRRDGCRVTTDRAVAADRVTLRFGAGIRSLTRDIAATPEAREVTQAVVPAFRFSTAEVEAPPFGQPTVTARFTQPVDLRAARGLIASEPSVAFSVTPEEWGGGVTLSGPFEVGQRYTLIFREGLRSAEGHRFEREVRRTVVVPHRAPAVSIAVSGRYLAPEGKLAVPVLAVNAPQVVSSLSRVLPQNLVQLAMREAGLYDSWWGGDARAVAQALTGRGAVRTNALDAARDQEQRLMLRLGDYFPERMRGVYLLEVGAEGVRSPSRLVCVTDIGLSARLEAGSVQVWVTGLRSGQGSPGLRLELFGRNNQLLAQGESGADGRARLAFDAAEGEPLLLSAAAADGSDATFLPLTDQTQVELPADAERDYPDGTRSEAFVMTDRELYRHGETVFVQTLLRQRDGRPPAPFPVSLEVLKPDGRLFKAFPLMPDSLGAASVELSLPEYLPSGTYGLQVRVPGGGAELGSCRVMVEAFVPPQIRVSLPDLPAAVGADGALAFAVRAEHLFGKAAAGLPVAADVTCSAGAFKPSGWEDYAFGDAEKALPFTQVRCARQTLDEAGSARFSARLDAKGRAPQQIDAVIQGTVTETGGRTVTARAVVPFHPYPFYLGLKPEAGQVVRIGEPLTVRVAAVNPDGARRRERVPLKVALEQVSWVSNLRKDRSGFYQWSSERVKTPVPLAESACEAGEEDACFRFTAQVAGAFVLTFSDPASGSSASWAFAAGGEGQSEGAWDRSRPDRVELVLDKPSYQPGETARLQIRAPFAGQAWVAVMQAQTLESRVLTLTNNTVEIGLEVGEAYAPNVEVAVSVVRPAVAESAWSAHRAVGLVPLRVLPAERRLAVRVSPEEAVWRPKSVLPVHVSVRDSAGRPAAGARATVLAVDEGVCMLTDYRTPDPCGFFLETRAGGLAFYDVYRQLMPITDERIFGTASHIGGDGGDGMLKRINPVAARRFKPLARWRADVALDAQGEATVPFELPEFAGELRLMAVAWDARATGSGEAPVKIRRRLVVQPDLPRVLAPGDAAQMQITLHNESGAACTARVSAVAQGPLACEAATQEVALATGASANVALAVSARDAAGVAQVTVTVDGAGEHYEEPIELAVRPAEAWRVTTEHHVLASGETARFEPPAGVMPSSFSQTLRCGAPSEVDLLAALEYVTEYPYGCLEQTVSSAFPLLALGRLAGSVPTGESTLAQEAPARIGAALLRVLSMRRHAGFAMWPEVWEPDRVATVYAAHFLVEAAKAGYPVGRDVLDDVVRMLENRLDDECDANAYICHVLALAERPDVGWTLRLYEQAESLPVENRLHLARALLRSGEINKGREILDGVRDVHGLREAAFGLLAWNEIDPQAPFAAACRAEIAKARREEGHWGTTQNNALALLALGTAARELREGPQRFDAAVEWSGGACESGATNAFAWASAAGGGAVKVTNRGPGTLCLARRVQAVPLAEAEPARDCGLKVRREWLDLEGNLLDAATLRRGDLVIVRLTLEPVGEGLGDVVVEDLLPACLEIETADLAKARSVEWIAGDASEWVLHREARDDRLLLFSKRLTGVSRFFYAARVVTPGTFAVPAVRAEGMYAPDRYSRSGAGRVTVQ